MKAEDLRFGNWIIFDDVPYQWSFNAVRDMEFETEYIGEPIPLTGECMERLGAVEKDVAGLRSEWVHVTEFLEFNWSEDSGLIVFIVGSQDSISMKHIDSVHLYQNLYHALTGEELTLKQ